MTRTLKPSTLGVYRAYLAEIAAGPLGGMILTDIRRADVQAWINLLARNRGAQRVGKIAVILKGAFSDAERSEIIASNPARLIDLPAIRPREKALWTPEQVSAFIEATDGSRVRSLYEVAIYTGVRRGELVGLRWSDIDMKARTLTVNVNRVQVARRGDTTAPQVYEGTANTRAGQGRVVGLGTRAVRALRQQRVIQNTDRLAAGEVWEDTGYVFTREDGTPILPEYASRTMEKVAAGAGLPPMSLHGLRHLHATHLRETGADGFLIAKRLGHAQDHVTAIYAHVSVTAQIEAADRAERIVPAGASTHLAVVSTHPTAKAAGDR